MTVRNAIDQTLSATGKQPIDSAELLSRYAAGERDFKHVSLSGADLSHAVLTAAHLAEADLSGALLVEADLSNAILHLTCLSEANLHLIFVDPFVRGRFISNRIVGMVMSIKILSIDKTL